MLYLCTKFDKRAILLLLRLRYIVLFFLPLFSLAQSSEKEVDLIEDYNRLHDKVVLYQQINLDTGKLYLDSVFQVTAALNQDYYLAKSFQLKSQHFMQSSTPDSALFYCNEAIKILNEYPDSMDYFVAQYNLGTIYLQFEDHIHALVQFKSVIELIDSNFEDLIKLDQQKVNLNRAYAYVSIGLVYGQLGDHQNGLVNLKKGIKISYKVDSEESERLRAVTLGNIGITYYNLGDYDMAESYAIAGMEQKSKLKMEGTVGYNYQILAKAAFGRGKYELCRKYLEQSDKRFKAFNNYIELHRNNYWKAKCLFEENKFNASILLLKELEPVYKTTFSERELAELYAFESEVYAKMGKMDYAYEYLLISNKIKEVINTKNDHQMVGEFLDFFERSEERMNHRLQSLRNKQAKEKLELQIAGDHEKKIWVYSLFTISILGLLLIIFVIAKAYQRNKRINRKLNESIHENQVLFREVHHRVKNNFQIISSLLNLQQGIEEDARGKKVLIDAQGRIQSMALVHEMLYQKNEVKRIDFKTHTTELVSSILKSFSDGDMIEYSIVCSDEKFDLEVAIPIGLILNEAITNSVKYAFNELKIGKIKVELQSLEEDHYRLIIRDNGSGIPDDYIDGSKETLGIELINILSSQLNGTATFSNNGGTEVMVEFQVTN